MFFERIHCWRILDRGSFLDPVSLFSALSNSAQRSLIDWFHLLNLPDLFFRLILKQASSLIWSISCTLFTNKESFWLDTRFSIRVSEHELWDYCSSDFSYLPKNTRTTTPVLRLCSATSRLSLIEARHTFRLVQFQNAPILRCLIPPRGLRGMYKLPSILFNML